MKNCTQCGNQLVDDATFCPFCGAKAAAGDQAGQPAPGYAQPAAQPMPGYGAQPGMYAPVAVVSPYDHTSEFDPKDISDYKACCMLMYLLGTLGVIIGLLAGQSSPYTQFHVRQAMKFIVLEMLLLIVGLVLCFTLIVPIAAAIAAGVLYVVRIICFVQICMGKAVEPVIVRSLGFLK